MKIESTKLYKQLCKVMPPESAKKNLEDVVEQMDEDQCFDFNTDILTAFVWSESPQGHMYWMGVANKLAKVGMGS